MPCDNVTCNSVVFTWKPSCGLDIYELGHRHSPGPADFFQASQSPALGTLGRLSGTGGHSDGRSGHFEQIPALVIEL